MAPSITGIPQGSVLSPLIYTLYINKLTDLVNNYNTCQYNSHLPSKLLFNRNCDNCGNIPSYATDTIVVFSSNGRNVNQTNIVQNLDKFKNFLLFRPAGHQHWEDCSHGMYIETEERHDQGLYLCFQCY